MNTLDETHDPARKSFVDSANQPGAEFPIQNLPLGVFSANHETRRIGVAIGDRVLDLDAFARSGRIPEPLATACRAPRLNELMALGLGPAKQLRRMLSDLLRDNSPQRRDVEPLLLPLERVDVHLPAEIGDYTDFYAGIHHATNVGRMFRPDNPLLPNYKYVPIAYHGRASSVVVSGTPVRRPCGQIKSDSAQLPEFAPSRQLDFELELGFYVARGNELGRPIPIGEAADYIFGFCLVNDWSARDIQRWEYQPLGPFLAKSFATSVSPWLVTADALAPFRAPAFVRADGDPAPLPYLDDPQDRATGALDVALEVHLSGELLTRASALDLYWTPAQMVAHHSSNGCNLRPGDLIATGTISGATPESRGCLLEQGRGFLQEGDEVVFKGWCRRAGFVPISFGECRGKVVS